MSVSLLEAIRSENNIDLTSFKGSSYRPFFVASHHVGWMAVPFCTFLQTLPQLVFFKSSFLQIETPYKAICLTETLDDEEKRTSFFGALVKYLRELLLEEEGLAPELQSLLRPLTGWRDEAYGVWKDPYAPHRKEDLLFRIERSAVSLFGLTSYGVHINGWIVDAEEDGQNSHQHDQVIPTDLDSAAASMRARLERRRHAWKMWVGQRSLSKFTHPGKLDQMVGCLTAHM